MTPQSNPQPFTTRAFKDLGAPELVYVREIAASEILTETDGGDHVEGLQPDQNLYAVYGADGSRLAILTDKESAFAAAVAHELVPVSVH